LVVAAVVLATTQLGGDDDTASAGPEDSGQANAEPMSAESAKRLRDQLEDADWSCYDSLDEPVIYKQCYLLKTEGEEQPTGRLSIQYAGEDTVATVQFHVGPDSPVQNEIVEQVSTM